MRRIGELGRMRAARFRKPSPNKVRERKLKQLDEAFTLYGKAMKELSKRIGFRFPGFSEGVKKFLRSIKAGKVKVLVEPGNYIERTGEFVTKARIRYRPGGDFFVVEVPAGMFDPEGNLKPEAMLDLFHELTHGVRSFIPQIQNLPTAYDEATTNYIAKWSAMYVDDMMRKGKIKTRQIRVNPENLRAALYNWEKDLVYKPSMVEGILGDLGKSRKDAKEELRIYTEFARGWMKKVELEEKVRKALISIKTGDRLDHIRKFRELLHGDEYRRIEERVKKLPYSILISKFPRRQFNENRDFLEHLMNATRFNERRSLIERLKSRAKRRLH